MYASKEIVCTYEDENQNSPWGPMEHDIDTGLQHRASYLYSKCISHPKLVHDITNKACTSDIHIGLTGHAISFCSEAQERMMID